MQNHQLIHFRCVETGHSSELVRTNSDGSLARVIAPVDGFYPTLAPDEQQIACARRDAHQQMTLWVVNLDGSDLRKVLDLPNDAMNLRWDAVMQV